MVSEKSIKETLDKLNSFSDKLWELNFHSEIIKGTTKELNILTYRVIKPDTIKPTNIKIGYQAGNRR